VGRDRGPPLILKLEARQERRNTKVLEAFVKGFFLLIDPLNFGMLIVGVIIGSILGFIPGVGGVVGVALILPFTFLMEPEVALPLIIGLVAVVTTADTIPCVLIGTPGSAGSQATILDGYPMAKNGEAGKALGAAFFVSAVGGVIGAILLSVSVPIFRPLVLSFGISEFLAMGILGLSMVAVLTGRSPLRGVIAAGLGLLLAMVGQDPINAIGRWYMGFPYLLGSLNVVAVALGLFALPELVDLCAGGSQIHRHGGKVEGKLSGVKEAMRHKRLILGSSIIGAWIGFLPGMGTVVANWVSYSCALMFCKPKDKFGKGDIRGVIAPESANNASVGGALIPTLAFGIPGSTVMALMLAALWIQGITPGQSLLTEKLHLVYLVIWSLAVANILGAVLAYAFTDQIARLTNVRIQLLAPLIIVPVLSGSLLTTNHIGDVIVLLIFGVVGWLMKHLGWPRPALVLGFVLGPMLEKYYFQTTMIFGNTWLQRPIVIAILTLAALGVFFGYRLRPR
jgi:TctA family transporter